MNTEEIQTVVLTCYRPDGERILEWFVASIFDQPTLDHALVVLDISQHQRLPRWYVDELTSISDGDVLLHPFQPDMDMDTGTLYRSAQHAAWTAVSEGAHAARARGAEFVLFVEDDVIFSTQFQAYLENLAWPEDCGMLSLYLPGGGHGFGQDTPEGGTRRVDPDCFYGTQAVIFPVHLAEQLCSMRIQFTSKFGYGYDIGWSRGVRELGYAIHESPKSYVQHVGTVSALHPGRFHESAVFVP